MSILEVPGARLYHEVSGRGELLLLVPGSNGEAGIFAPVGEQLAEHYTVVTYDRRGFSRSELDGPQDYDRRLESDADDVRRLIEDLGEGPATLLGASSGAIVVLEVLARYPEVVRTVVALEPPAMMQLDDGQEWVDFFHEIYGLYRRSGMDAAGDVFRKRAFVEADQQLMAQRARYGKDSQHSLANATYWFEHELRQYPPVDLDLDALRAHASRLILAVGRESRGTPCHEVGVALGRRLGCEVAELPGGHVGYVSHTTDFARDLLATLRR